MSEFTVSETLTESTVHTLRRHRTAALELPPPGEDWALAETALEGRDLQTLSQIGAVRQHSVERVRVSAERADNGGNYTRKRWETDRGVYEWVQDHLTDAAECPGDDCHATGVFNPPGAEGYRCNNDDCDERLSEAQARTLIR